MAERLPIIEVEGLTRYYGDFLAVDHIHFQIQRGEIFGFLGPNGAGKTTTVRILTGLLTPTAGSAIVLGHDVVHERLAIKSLVGIVPEQSNLYHEMTVRGNLIFMAQLYGLPRREWGTRADELLQIFRLWEVRNRRFGRLSRGMKRRLTIAAALVHRPQLLFLDEPTTGLDVVSARELRALITELNRQGVTLFLTTHLISEAETLCHRVAIIVGGRLRVIDTPSKLCQSAGGRSMLEIELAKPVAAWKADLEALLGAERVAVEDQRLRIPADGLHEMLIRLLPFLQEHGIFVHNIRAVTPTLENAFVVLTGLDLDDMRREKGGGGQL